MIRTTEENREWWKKLSALQRSDLFDELRENAPTATDFITSLQSCFIRDGSLSDGRLAALRKFADNLRDAR